MKTNFLFYKEWWEVIKDLQPELRLQVYDALTSFAFEGAESPSQVVGYITALMRITIERDSAKWEEIKEKRSEAGKKHKGNQYNKLEQTEQVEHLSQNGTNGTVNVNVNDNVNGSNSSNELCRPKKEKNILKKESGFIPPTVEEVSAYCKERDNGIDAETFVAHYEAIGWMVGRAKMKNWKQAVITWEKRNKANAKPTNLGYGEFIDNNGRRTYADGAKAVPMEAPPRPSRDYWWNTRENRWDNNWI